MNTSRTHMIRTVVYAAALLCAAPPLYAQCSWEHDTPRGRREAREDSIYKAVRQAQRGAIRSALQAAGVSEPRGVVVVTAARTGADPVIRAYEANFPAAVLDSAAPALVERMKELPARQGGRVAAVMRLDTTALPPARADRRRRDCSPVLLNRDLIVNEFQNWASTMESGSAVRAALVGLAVSRDGRVLYSELARSSGSDALDHAALQLTARLQFRPASVDGVTRDVWAVLPINLR